MQIVNTDPVIYSFDPVDADTAGKLTPTEQLQRATRRRKAIFDSYGKVLLNETVSGRVWGITYGILYDWALSASPEIDFFIEVSRRLSDTLVEEDNKIFAKRVSDMYTLREEKGAADNDKILETKSTTTKFKTIMGA